MADRILFVDDEPDLESLIRQKYRKEIRQGTMVLEFARDGRQALDILKADPDYSIVMTDIRMPRMGGLQLLQEIKQRDQDITVIIISAFGDMANIRVAMNYGAFDFLTKPIDFEDLEITRRKALEHVNKLHERVRLAEEKRELEESNLFIRDIFGRYLSDSIVKVLLDSKDGLQLGGERRLVTILMSDLRGFSILAERFAAEQIIATLNHYFSVMIDVLLEYGGIIDEIQGDSILAIFGAPLHQEDSAPRAVACALAMQEAMHEVTQHNLRHRLPPISMGIGVHTGEVVLGNIGSHKRTKYGVVGSNVNLTARIQAQAIGGQVMVSEATFEACAPYLDVGGKREFRAKGFERPVTVFELLGIHGRYELSLPGSSLALTGLAKEVPVEFISAAEHGDASWRQGAIVGLSETGIEVRAAHSLETGDLTIIRFLTADRPALVYYAKVVDDRLGEGSENGFKAWFVALSAAAREYLQQVIAAGDGSP